MRKNQINKIYQNFFSSMESHFVSEAIRKELDLKNNELRDAYLSANKDEGQREVIYLWKQTVL